MKIILMRHGQAEGYRHPDKTRQLTAFGRTQAEETADYLLNKYSPDMFVVSPYDRAQQTLEAVTQLSTKMGRNIPTQVLNDITPDSNPRQALESLYELSVSAKSLDGSSVDVSLNDVLSEPFSNHVSDTEDTHTQQTITTKVSKVDTMMVVCHMPIVARLVSLLTGELPIAYELAEARIIETSVLVEDLGTQIDRFSPKQYS